MRVALLQREVFISVDPIAIEIEASGGYSDEMNSTDKLDDGEWVFEDNKMDHLIVESSGILLGTCQGASILNTTEIWE